MQEGFFYIISFCVTDTLETIHKLRRQLEGEGGQPKTHFCLLCLMFLPMKGEGIKNSKNHAYVVYGWPLCTKCIYEVELIKKL